MDYTELKHIINSKVFEEISSNQVHLIEPIKDKNTKLKKIILKNIPDNSVVIKADKFSLNTIFREGKPYIKRCDYLLVSDNTIFFIELKSNEKAPEKKIRRSFVSV